MLLPPAQLWFGIPQPWVPLSRHFLIHRRALTLPQCMKKPSITGNPHLLLAPNLLKLCIPLHFSIGFLAVCFTHPWVWQWGHLACIWTWTKTAPSQCRTEAVGCGSWVHTKDGEHPLLPSMQASKLLLPQTPACIACRHNHYLGGFGKPALENLPSVCREKGMSE